MHTNRAFNVVFGVVITAMSAETQTTGQAEPLWRRVLRMSDAEQVAMTKSTLDAGLPGDQSSAITALVLNRSSLVLPLIEKKIEEVLKAASPADCFSRKDVDPRTFVGAAQAAISYAGDEQALTETAKLLRLDEKRFDRMVDVTLTQNIGSRRDPFALAYWALSLGDPAIDKRVAAWVADQMGSPYREYPGGPPSAERQWAAVLVERYRGVPVQDKWQNDPVVSRLKPEVAASLRDEVYRFAMEEWEKNPRHVGAMADTEVGALTKARLDNAKARFDQRLPVDSYDTLFALARARSSIVLPIIENRIEELTASNPPAAERLRGLLGFIIAAAADKPALEMAAKLIKQVPGSSIDLILSNAAERGNPFDLVYQGLDMHDPGLDKQLIAWADRTLSQPALNTPKDMRHQWATVLAARYGGAPTPAQWSKDPLASRLKPGSAESFYAEVAGLAADAAQKR